MQNANLSGVTNLLAQKSITKKELKNGVVQVDDLNALMKQKLNQIDMGNGSNKKSLSIYNEEGIKAAVQVNAEVILTYELSIPLKLLGLTPGTKFAYNLKLNELIEQKVHNTDHEMPPPPMASTALSPTDFWGEYKLID